MGTPRKSRNTTTDLFSSLAAVDEAAQPILDSQPSRSLAAQTSDDRLTQEKRAPSKRTSTFLSSFTRTRFFLEAMDTIFDIQRARKRASQKLPSIMLLVPSAPITNYNSPPPFHLH